MVRTMLSRYAPLEAAQWQFAANAEGRPEVSSSHPETAGLCFNVSLASAPIAPGVTRRLELGMDVEQPGARRVALHVADHVFAPAGVAALRAVPTEAQSTRFLEYWTFKEA